MKMRLAIDPVTRIEGHLRIEAQLEDGVVREAYSSGTQFRGLEIIMQGRDPRDAWAFAQRICGVCTLVHGMASVRAVENALGIEIPKNAELVRNLMIAAQFVHDHVMHFYHLHALDWVDVVAALQADPAQTAAWLRAMNPETPTTAEALAETKRRVQALVQSGQLGLFANGYWGHPEYKLPPEAGLMALTHYLDALQWQREVAKLHAIFGGKNPHPNLVVGGVPCPIDFSSETAINAAKLDQVRALIAQMQTFVDHVYLPDVLAIAAAYPEWATRGEGTGNFLGYGDLQLADGSRPLFPAGVLLDRDLSRVQPLDAAAPDQIKEYVAHAWYAYAAGRDQGLHPHAGETTPAFDGPKPPYEQLDVSGGYSWIKAPRWRDKVAEVGPLARVLLMYARGDARAVQLVDATLGQLKLPKQALFSTLGRTAARALETKLLADEMSHWLDSLIANVEAGDTRTVNADKWDPASWPKHAQGIGLMEAPRGGLAHFVVIDDAKISNYQAVVPSTWNAGPRDARGQPGPYEASLVGHTVHDPAQPLELLRTIHSFDPCIACAVHLMDARGLELGRAKVL